MPEFIKQNVVCKRCWRPTMVEHGETILTIGTVIFIRAGQDNKPVWTNICSQHIQTIDDWINNRIKRLPRGVSGSQEVLEISQESLTNSSERITDDIPYETRKSYLEGKYIGKYSG